MGYILKKDSAMGDGPYRNFGPKIETRGGPNTVSHEAFETATIPCPGCNGQKQDRYGTKCGSCGGSGTKTIQRSIGMRTRNVSSSESGPRKIIP